jgi:hypothetical protein
MSCQKYMLWGLLAILLNSCQKSPKTTHALRTITAQERAICRDGGCPEFSVSFPFFEGDATTATRLNQQISSWFIAALFLGDDNAPTASDIGEALDQYLLLARDYQSEFTPRNSYRGQLNAGLSYQNKYVLSLFLSIELNPVLHPNKSRGAYLNFDQITGRLIPLQELVSNPQGLSDVIRVVSQQRAYGAALSAKDAINQISVWQINQSLGFDADGLAMVTTNKDPRQNLRLDDQIIQLPWAQITPFLNPQYFR